MAYFFCKNELILLFFRINRTYRRWNKINAAPLNPPNALRIMKLSLLTTASSQSKMNHFFLPDESVDEQFLRIVGEVNMVIGSENGS